MPTPRTLHFIDPSTISELNQQEDTASDPSLILEAYEAQVDDVHGERNFDNFINGANSPKTN